MKGEKIFLDKHGIFSEKEYKLKLKEEEKLILERQKERKKKYLEEKQKQKILKELRKKREKEIKDIKKELKNPLQKKFNFEKPTIPELEKHLIFLSEKYDSGILKMKKLHDELKFLGLTPSGLKEYSHETERKKSKRIKKINEIHKLFILILEKNKQLEKQIEILERKIREEKSIKNNYFYKS